MRAIKAFDARDTVFGLLCLVAIAAVFTDLSAIEHWLLQIAMR